MKVHIACFTVALMVCLNGCSEPTSTTPDAMAVQEAETTATNESAGTTTDEVELQADAEPSAPPTQEEQINEVRSLYSSGNFDEAEARFTSAREAFPDSADVKRLHETAAQYLWRGDRKQKAYDHLAAMTDFYMEGDYDYTGYVQLFGSRLGALARWADQLEGTPDGEAVFAEYATRTADISPTLPAIVTAQRAIYLAENGRIDEARELAESNLAFAQERLDANAGDADAILRVANALEDRVSIEAAAEDGGIVDQARGELLDYLFAQAKEHPTLAPIRHQFVADHLAGARSLAYTDPDSAAELLARIDEFEEQTIATLDDAQLKQHWSDERNMGGMADDVARRVKESRQRFALIGTPALFPDNADAWVGVKAPITSDDLRGRVVLLDFFAVWCGPCIATFPHLRAWHDEFSDDGLAIIGISDYHSYDWDEEAGRSKRVSDLEPAAERAGMEKFADHHGLSHPIAFVDNSDLDDHYVVKGIPHVVLIDRAGKVRMHRIGSGERNAADLEQAIEECLAEPAPAETEPS